MPLRDVPTVHAVTDAGILAAPGFLDRARQVLRALGPRGAVHLRGHGMAGRDLWLLADSLAPFQAESGGWVIVNDRVDVAASTRATGAQLGQRSLLVGDARHIGPSLRLGVSVHSIDEAAAAAAADWWLAGHIFATPSHPGEPGRGLEFVGALAGRGVPVIAIGGVTPASVGPLRDAGAHGVAAIRGIWGAPDPSRAAMEYL